MRHRELGDVLGQLEMIPRVDVDRPGHALNVTAPMTSRTMGSDSGRSLRYSGSHAASSTMSPAHTHRGVGVHDVIRNTTPTRG